MNEESFYRNKERIKRTLHFALNNPFCGFYRFKYKDIGFDPTEIKSYSDFQQIPHLSKNELLALKPMNMLFVDEKDVKRIHYTAGTTDRKNPLIVPKSNQKPVSYDFELAKELGVRTILYLNSAVGPVMTNALSFPVEGLITIPGDVTKLEITAHLATEVGIEGIRTTPTLLYEFSSYLDGAGFDKGSLKWILLSAEFCTAQRLEYFQKQFPKAHILFRYGSTEIGTRGYRCGVLSTKEPWLFHPPGNAFIEVEGNASVDRFQGAGEIIHTDLSVPKAFPFIRYKSGDIAFIKEERCQCGSDQVLGVAGRKGSDFFSKAGYAVQTQNIADCLEEVKEYIELPFQLHIRKNELNDKEVLELALMITLKDGAGPDILERAKTCVSENLELQPGKNIKSLINEGRVLPLKVKAVRRWPENRTKSINIVFSEQR